MKTTVEKLSPTRVKLNLEVPRGAEAQHRPRLRAHRRRSRSPASARARSRQHHRPARRPRPCSSTPSTRASTASTRPPCRKRLRPLGRPEADIIEVGPTDNDGDLKLQVEVDVRPEIDLPDYDGLEVEVDAVEVVRRRRRRRLDAPARPLRHARHVDRPAADGDFVTIDLVATIDGVEVDPRRRLVRGRLRRAARGHRRGHHRLTAGEDTTFDSKLVGGDHAGEDAEVTVTVKAVKERELPEADDDFAQIASEFDTIAELRENLPSRSPSPRSSARASRPATSSSRSSSSSSRFRSPRRSSRTRCTITSRARTAGEARRPEHRAEVTENTEKTFRTQILLDTIAEEEEVKVSQDELTQYLCSSAGQYGMDPNEFVQLLDQNGQLP